MPLFLFLCAGATEAAGAQEPRCIHSTVTLLSSAVTILCATPCAPMVQEQLRRQDCKTAMHSLHCHFAVALLSLSVCDPLCPHGAGATEAAGAQEPRMHSLPLSLCCRSAVTILCATPRAPMVQEQLRRQERKNRDAFTPLSLCCRSAVTILCATPCAPIVQEQLRRQDRKNRDAFTPPVTLLSRCCHYTVCDPLCPHGAGATEAAGAQEPRRVPTAHGRAPRVGSLPCARAGGTTARW